MMDPYFSDIETDSTSQRSSHPTVTAYLDRRDECCSSLDCSASAVDEERAVLPRANDDHPTASLSRRVMDSPPLKRCIFFSCVFLLLSGVGLAAVGSGLFLTRSHGGGGGAYDGGRGSFHAGGFEVNGVEMAWTTDEDSIGDGTSKVAASDRSQANSANLPDATVPNAESTEIWGTEPTAAIEMSTTTEASKIDPAHQDTSHALHHDMAVPADLIEFEFSMSMIIFDDELNMPEFPQDVGGEFQRFDDEVDASMSMKSPSFTEEEEEQDFQQFDDQIDVSMSMTSPGFTNLEEEEGDFQKFDDEIDASMPESVIPVVSTASTELAVATKPFPNRDCVQAMCSVELSPELLMEYQLDIPSDSVVEDGCQGCAISIKLTYDGIAWLGFGFSTTGAMVGSEAVIGVPVKGSKEIPQKYILGGMSLDDIQPMSEEHQTLQNASIKIGKMGDEIKTVMKFTKFLKEGDEIEVFTGDNTFIWAYGVDETLGYHAARSSFNLNLLGDTSDATSPSTPMITDPTTSQAVTEGTVAINGEDIAATEATSGSSTVLGTVPTDDIDIMAVTVPTATEGTVTTNMVTGGTIGSGAFDISATITEPTTDQVVSKNSSDTSDSSNTPTYYPTTAPVMLMNIFTPITDTFLEFNSSESFGIRSRLRVDGQPQRITLLRFDMSPLVRNKAVELVSAKLRLYALTSSAYGGRVDIVDEDICTEWDEGISWKTAPPGVFADAPDSLGTFGEITEYKWNDAALTLNLQFIPLHFTVRISSDRGNGVTYASKENSTAVPKLIIKYMGIPFEGTEAPTPSPVASKEALTQSAFEITSSPTDRPTRAPSTDSPTTSPPEPVEIKVGRDAMLRNGRYSDSLFGYDPFIAMKSSTNPDWEGKSILQFDLSDLSPDVDYSYELKLFITFVDSDDERTITVFQLTENFLWGEEWITWDRLGNPAMESLGSEDIRPGDVGSYVSIPLKQVNAINDRVNLVLEITSGPSEGSKVDYMASENGSNPPLLIATP